MHKCLFKKPQFPAVYNIDKILRNALMRILFLSRHFPTVRLVYVTEVNWQRGIGKTPYWHFGNVSPILSSL